MMGKKRLFSMLLTMIMVFSLLMGTGITTQAASTVTLTFSNDGITETVAGTGYKFSDTTLTIKSAGTYKVTGSCSEGAIEVNKGVGNVILILDNLTLASSSTAPIIVKKTDTSTEGYVTNNVTLHLNGTNTITDNEDIANETSTDTTVSEAFEGAAIKVKSNSNLTVCGDGTLTLNGCKNGIKGAESSSVIINSGNINVGTSSDYIDNNGIVSDGSIVINGGTFNIFAENDAIKSVPDSDDTTSAGTITINGGSFDIDSNGDGIQAANDLTINNGTFDIKTYNGYNGINTKWYYVNAHGNSDNISLSDTESRKGIKVSGAASDETESQTGTLADTSEETCTLNINGGTFVLNTSDDAIHSDAYATIAGGTFTINAGDDGMHADTSLVIGKEGGNDRDPEITVKNCYEGLEGGTVYVYSGKSYVYGQDDGINAAGGSSGQDNMNPGGGPGGPGSNRPGAPDSSGGSSTTTSDYAIYVYGGNIYINVEGDGIDSNGNIYFYGGNTEVWGMKANGDNEPIDCDGKIYITDATVFAGGGKGMNYVHSETSTIQKYAYSTSSYSNGTTIYVKDGNSVIYSASVPKQVAYMFYTSPGASSSVSFATSGSATCNVKNAWSHTWNDGVTSNGVTTYTCSVCGATEKKTVVNIDPITCDGHENADSGEEEEEDEGCAVTFTTDEGVAGIDVYYTQDYTTANETDVTSTVSRNSDTGEPDSSGNGQLNFLVRLNDGYSIEDINVTGDYKNLKGSDDTGKDNVYRITKIKGELTVSVTTIKCSHNNLNTASKSWAWENDYSKAQVSFTCDDCSNTVTYDGIITSVLNADNTVTFTASYTDAADQTYTDTKTADAFVANFSVEHATVDVYYTSSDYSTASETNVTAAVARDSSTGYPVISGDGQINFKVNPDDGYEVDAVTATTGTYKNIKEPADTGADNTYRITKVTGNTTITITMKEASDNGGSGDGDGDDDSDSTDTTDSSTSGTGAGSTSTDSTGTDGTASGSSDTSTSGTNTSTSGTDASASDTSASSDVTTGSSTSTYAARLAQKGEDGTEVGKGASYEAAEQAITTMISDADPKGSEFGVLCARATKTTNTSVKLKWNKASGAVKYVIYANKCGKKNKCIKVAEVTKNTYTYKKLKKATYYKFIVVALDSNNNVVTTSKLVHAATTGGKVGNCKKVTTKGGTKVTVKSGKTYKLNGKAVKGTLKIKKHRTAVCYESSDTSVATVTSKGVIKGVKKGTCYIYAYAQNGTYKKIKVTIK